MKPWSRSDKLALTAVLVTILGTAAAIVVVPEARSFLGLDQPSTSSNLADRIKSLPTKVWTIFVLALMLWFLVLLGLMRARTIRRRSSFSASVVYVPPFGWEPVAELNHGGVLWTVRAPKTHFVRITEEPRIDPQRLNIQTPPKCPECKTELEEDRAFFGGHLWTCIRCEFRKRNKDDYYKEADRALRMLEVSGREREGISLFRYSVLKQAVCGTRSEGHFAYYPFCLGVLSRYEH